jgi:hypothetical protein
MGGKQMEGDNRERRRKAKEARDQGSSPSEEGATQGASKQREKVGDVDHREKIETIRKGKQDIIQQNTPEPKPGYAEESD